jgi:hypothetical protein
MKLVADGPQRLVPKIVAVPSPDEEIPAFSPAVEETAIPPEAPPADIPPEAPAAGA